MNTPYPPPPTHQPCDPLESFSMPPTALSPYKEGSKDEKTLQFHLNGLGVEVQGETFTQQLAECQGSRPTLRADSMIAQSRRTSHNIKEVFSKSREHSANSKTRGNRHSL